MIRIPIFLLALLANAFVMSWLPFPPGVEVLLSIGVGVATFVVMEVVAG